MSIYYIEQGNSQVGAFAREYWCETSGRDVSRPGDCQPPDALGLGLLPTCRGGDPRTALDLFSETFASRCLLDYAPKHY